MGLCSQEFTSRQRLKELVRGKAPGRIGRHRVNLLQVIKKDLKQHDIKLSSYEDVIKLRELAWNRNAWRDMYKPVT